MNAAVGFGTRLLPGSWDMLSRDKNFQQHNSPRDDTMFPTRQIIHNTYPHPTHWFTTAQIHNPMSNPACHRPFLPSS
eukprot:9362859-Pyramimonas_sp.AAC.1